MAQHPSAVAYYGFRRHRTIGDDLADLVTTISTRYVVNDQVAFVHAEINVEIRHGDPFGIQKTFEQEFVRQGIEIRNAQCISHQ